MMIIMPLIFLMKKTYITVGHWRDFRDAQGLDNYDVYDIFYDPVVWNFFWPHFRDVHDVCSVHYDCEFRDVRNVLFYHDVCDLCDVQNGWQVVRCAVTMELLLFAMSLMNVTSWCSSWTVISDWSS
jgi:hypothetical protein